MIREAKSHQIKKNDGVDFVQAVMASSVAQLATLDTEWKRRIEAIPQPNQLAHIYSPNELDAFVQDVEGKVSFLDANLSKSLS